MNINLAYHSIADSAYEHAVPPSVFKEQMAVLSRKYNMVFASEVCAQGSNEGAVTYRASVMFDDGMRDNYTRAFPIVQAICTPISIFIITSLVGKEQVTPGGVRIPMLTWDDMREMVESGLVRVECHTHTHPLLTDLRDDEIEEEIKRSKELIYQNLGYESRAFAYPKGNFDERVKNCVRKHFDVAFGTVGTVSEDHTTIDHYAIPRIIVSKKVGVVKLRAMLHPLYWKLRYWRDYLYSNDKI